MHPVPMSSGDEIRIGRRTLRLTHPERVLFPRDGVTKGDLAQYYLAIGDVIVPHLRERPFTLKRYPHGIDGQAYFHKQAPKGKPRVDPDAAVPDLAARRRVAARRFHARQRDRSTRLDGADELHRHERVVLAGRQARAPGLRRLRPRPARVAQRLRAGDPGRAPDPRGARRARAAVVPEDERRRRHPRAGADHPALVVSGHLRLRGARVASGSRRTTPAS